jgi:hypothetical protein
VAACALRAVGVPCCAPVLVVAVAVEAGFGGEGCGSHGFWLMGIGLGWVGLAAGLRCG